MIVRGRKYARVLYVGKHEEGYHRPQHSRGPPADRNDPYLTREPETYIHKDYCFDNKVSEYVARGWTLDEAVKSFLPAEEIKVIISLVNTSKIYSAHFDPEEANKIMERKFAKESQYALAYITTGKSLKLYENLLRNSVTGELFTLDEHRAIKRSLVRTLN